MSRPGSGPAAQWRAPTLASQPQPGSGPAVQGRPRIADGILTGLAAAGIGGALWWAITVASVEADVGPIVGDGRLSGWHPFALLLGVFVGLGVVIGTRRGGAAAGAIAVVICLVAIPVCVYFIDRSTAIVAAESFGRPSDIPLWAGWSAAWEPVTGWFDYDRVGALTWLVAPLAALLIAGWPARRPIIR